MPSSPLKLFESLLSNASNEAQAWWQTISHSPTIMIKLGSAIAILVITLFLSRLLSSAVKRASKRFAHNDGDRTLPEFISQIVRWIILTIGFAAILHQLGIETTSFITVLGAASLSIGLALQGTLGNVAAGLMILINKPYRIGDSIKFGDVHGKVHRLGLFATEVDTFDGMRVFVPNAKLFANELMNVTTNGHARLDLKVGIGYGTDLAAAMALVQTLCEAQTDALSDPAPWVGLHEFADSAIVMRILVWCDPAHLLNLRSNLILDITRAFRTHGIEIPYPHQVHVEK